MGDAGAGASQPCLKDRSPDPSYCLSPALLSVLQPASPIPRAPQMRAQALPLIDPHLVRTGLHDLAFVHHDDAVRSDELGAALAGIGHVAMDDGESISPAPKPHAPEPPRSDDPPAVAGWPGRR